MLLFDSRNHLIYSTFDNHLIVASRTLQITNGLKVVVRAHLRGFAVVFLQETSVTTGIDVATDQFAISNVNQQLNFNTAILPLHPIVSRVSPALSTLSH